MRMPNIDGFMGMLSILESSQLSHGKDILEGWGYKVQFENRPKRNGAPNIFLVDMNGRIPKEFLTRKQRRKMRRMVRKLTVRDLKVRKGKIISGVAK